MTFQLFIKGRSEGIGDQPTVGPMLVLQPRGEDEKEAKVWDHHAGEELVIDVEIQGQPAVASPSCTSREAGTRKKPGLGPAREGRRKETKPWRRSLWILGSGPLRLCFFF